MTDLPVPNGLSGLALRKGGRRKWLWVASGVVTVGILTGLLVEAVDRVREAAARSRWTIDQLTIACLNYHDVNGHLPPAVVYGPGGKPLYSWRVLILPYMEHDHLYKQFKLDEPWDSPHNVQLLDRMPVVYAPPPSKQALVPPNHTICHVFIGPGTPFDGPAGRKLADFTDGTSDTFLLVEAGEPVPWTQPADLVYDPAGPLPPLRGLFKDGFRACTADRGRKWVRYDAPVEAVRAAVTRDGGEKVGLPW